MTLLSDRRNLILTTAGVVLGMFLAAIDATLVGTAMPTVIGSLGGLSLYTWVFSIYMLSSTITIPILGKLSDLFGRRRFFLLSIGVFIAASALCGLSQTMGQLIGFRALQGIGAGGLFALTFTIVGVVYRPEQRGRVQGMLSSVWAISSIIGPLTGGFLVDNFSWRWAFYVNVPLGVLAAGLILSGFHEPRTAAGRRISVDYLGSALLALGLASLLLFLLAVGRGELSPDVLVLGAMSLAAFAVFLPVERRAAEPIVPAWLFTNRAIALPNVLNLLAGMAIFGGIAFIPLFAQGVLGTSATGAGLTLTPLSIGWPLGSIIAGHLVWRVGYRNLSLTGLAVMSGGFFLLSRLSPEATFSMAAANTFLLGLGMGLISPTLIAAVQNAVHRDHLGVATASVQFFRTVGGVVGIAVMGALMLFRLEGELDGLPQARALSAQSLLQPGGLDGVSPEVLVPMREALGASIDGVFFLGFVLAALGLLVAVRLKGRPHPH